MRVGRQPYPQVVRERAVQMYWSDPRASCASVAREIGCSEESVRRWVHLAGQDAASDAGSTANASIPVGLADRLRKIESALVDLERRIVVLVAGSDYSEALALF